MSKMKIYQKRILLLLVIFTVSFLGGASVGGMTATKQAPSSIVNQVADGKVVNILLMGIDARSSSENSRSDTMILASIDTQNKKAVLVWIPRDTRIDLSSGQASKINAVNYLNGPDSACETVGQLLGTKVDYYAVLNFWGFVNIVNTLGGVDINVETDLRHFDPDPLLNINISKGLQHLNGEDALKYMRYRGMPTADIGRTEGQAKLIKALANQLFQTKTIFKMPQLLPEFLNSVHTNMPLDDIIYLLKSSPDFQNSEIITQTLPGYSFTDPRDGGSYWQADQTIANGIIDSLLAGKRYDIFQPQPSLPNQTNDSKADKSIAIPGSGQPDTQIPVTPGQNKPTLDNGLSPDKHQENTPPPAAKAGGESGRETTPPASENSIQTTPAMPDSSPTGPRQSTGSTPTTPGSTMP